MIDINLKKGRVMWKSTVKSLVLLSFIGLPMVSGATEMEDISPVEKVVKKRVKKSSYCKTCDYSRFPEAKTMPLEPGEHLKPAKLGNCGRK